MTIQGGRLYHVFGSTKAAPDKDRHVGQKAGRFVTVCNDIDDQFVAALWPLIDYDYYIKEVEKLLKLETV